MAAVRAALAEVGAVGLAGRVWPLPDDWEPGDELDLGVVCPPLFGPTTDAEWALLERAVQVAAVAIGMDVDVRL